MNSQQNRPSNLSQNISINPYLTNLVNNAKNITPYSNRILTSDQYMKTDKLIKK